ncbi:Uncharacterised protein [Mycobacteroides abscessus subsp. abscessus]|nr:hypothetical protein [Mycobacteroides abscessus]SID25528.1 Uncharacterised protein [Mycobacteroides abscessus subsp. abscessus]CPW03034.1 Uncharacterised protein [Mycobacteroides abscessus]SII03438.1 Uncharacterised protein [Mycobacteroides abscessus subsp. abscessus]SIJ26343.1 Uncharacterised protein [Mycobacteroides abscessus subsp. abscessus]
MGPAETTPKSECCGGCIDAATLLDTEEVGKRDWDRGRNGPLPRSARAGSWKLFVAVPICMTFVFVGVFMFAHPATCGSKPMTQWDRCQHYGRSHQRLLPGSETSIPADGYDRDSQIVYTRGMAIAAMTLGVGAWVLAAIWLWDKTLDWGIRQRRTQTRSRPCTSTHLSDTLGDADSVRRSTMNTSQSQPSEGREAGKLHRTRCVQCRAHEHISAKPTITRAARTQPGFLPQTPAPQAPLRMPAQNAKSKRSGTLSSS